IAETALFVNGVGSRDGGSGGRGDLVQAIQPMEDVNGMKDGKSSSTISEQVINYNLRDRRVSIKWAFALWRLYR
ncbi:hypothetical protein QR685DRAFT_444209, partial [Neurospora intermedia]